MRWYILRTLLHKEALRHLANRGGLVLVLLLIVAAMLLSFFGAREGPGGGLAPGLQLCYVDYSDDSPFLRHLRRSLPDELKEHVRFRPLRQAPTDAAGLIIYPHNAGAIQVRSTPDGPGFLVWFWHPGSDQGALAPYEAWFWKEAFRFTRDNSLPSPSPGTASEVARLPVAEQRSSLKGGFDARSGIATSLVLFGLFFVCVYLLPSLTCEERERGVLLAQALSPASPREILAAKFLFYPTLGVLLAVILAGTYQPRALLLPFFWLCIGVSAVGSLGIGLTIASLARTQRAASMGAMCYTLVVALLIFICQQNNIALLPFLALEYHTPRMLHAALTGSVLWYHWFHLAGAAFLALGWTLTAYWLFRRQGWQ